MAEPIRLPATILTTGASYTAALALGSAGKPISFILDTGSAILAVDGTVFDPVAAGCTTTMLLQQAQYLSGSFLCAVVRGGVTIGGAALVPQANLGVTYGGNSLFGGASGIWGLAYGALDAALQMPGDTWRAQYDASDLSLGKACDLAPLFDQAADAGLLARKFAFRVHRAVPCKALTDPATDTLNTGIFVAGGGLDCADLLTGAPSNIAVVAEHFYNVNLLAVQVGTEPAIPVHPPPAGSMALSNAFIDSGAPGLLLNQDVYDAVMTSFAALNADFGPALQQPPGPGVPQAALNLPGWPDMTFTFQAAGGGTTSVTVGAGAYWQEDAVGPGLATAMLQGDQHGLGGQSILGLPFFVGKYVVFDRTAANGRGVVTVA